MVQTEMDRLFAFIAFWTTSRADARGQNKLRSALLYSRLMALRSLASVALSSIQAIRVYHPVNPSRRGHLYFAD